jgi:hypothetical protein
MTAGRDRRRWLGRSSTLAICASIAGLIVVPLSLAHRPPTASEFKAVAAAVDHKTGHFYCAHRGAVDVSTVNPRWAAAFAISNCGSGSLEARFYLRRPTAHSARWQVIEATYHRGVGARGPACASARVPRDIRCGVHGRS